MMPKRKVGQDPEACDLILDESSPKELKTMHCPGCGFVAFQYYDRLRMIIASTAISPTNQDFGCIKGVEARAPYIFQCPNRNCRLRMNIKVV